MVMVIPLTQLAPGQEGVVGVVELQTKYALRLAELGIRPGIGLTMIQRTSGGGIVVKSQGSRIALDRGTATSIAIEVQG